MYDMWINECFFWPTNNPELWNKWDELKKIKVKKRCTNIVITRQYNTALTYNARSRKYF